MGTCFKFTEIWDIIGISDKKCLIGTTNLINSVKYFIAHFLKICYNISKIVSDFTAVVSHHK